MAKSALKTKTVTPVAGGPHYPSSGAVLSVRHIPKTPMTTGPKPMSPVSSQTKKEVRYFCKQESITKSKRVPVLSRKQV